MVCARLRCTYNQSSLGWRLVNKINNAFKNVQKRSSNLEYIVPLAQRQILQKNGFPCTNLCRVKHHLSALWNFQLFKQHYIRNLS